jgi:hypothetical protein
MPVFLQPSLEARKHNLLGVGQSNLLSFPILFQEFTRLTRQRGRVPVLALFATLLMKRLNEPVICRIPR